MIIYKFSDFENLLGDPNAFCWTKILYSVPDFPKKAFLL